MKTTTKLYLKSFILYGLIFGLIMTVWEYIDEEEINIWKQIFQGTFFGGLMSWTTVTAQKRALSQQGKKELTAEDFKVSQSELIAKEITIDEIYKLLKSNEKIKNWKLKIENSKIIGKTKTSWSSWGEKIIISELENKIKIESNPILITTFLTMEKTEKI